MSNNSEGANRKIQISKRQLLAGSISTAATSVGGSPLHAQVGQKLGPAAGRTVLVLGGGSLKGAFQAGAIEGVFEKDPTFKEFHTKEKHWPKGQTTAQAPPQAVRSATFVF